MLFQPLRLRDSPSRAITCGKVGPSELSAIVNFDFTWCYCRNNEVFETILHPIVDEISELPENSVGIRHLTVFSKLPHTPHTLFLVIAPPPYRIS